MIEVHFLEPGEKLPSDQDWVALTKTPSGGYELSACVGQAKAAAFGFARAEPLRVALDRARQQADRLNINAVYVSGATDAERD